MGMKEIQEKCILFVERLKEVGDDLYESIKLEAKTYGEVEAMIERSGVIMAWKNKAEAEYLTTYMRERLEEEERGLPLKK